MLGLAGGLAGSGLVAAGYGLGTAGRETTSPQAWPFPGKHQSGVATPPQNHLVFTAFDLTGLDQLGFQDLLRSWSRLAADLQAGHRARSISDPGEAEGLDAARLTLTFGLGPGVFERDGEDVLGLRDRQPTVLYQIPALPGDELQAARSGGDVCVQACADDPQVAFHAVHALSLAARGVLVPRWSQTGFLPRRQPAGARSSDAPRNLMGFRDGTHNVRPDDAAQMSRHVWVAKADDPSWMRDGTYLVARRIRMLLDVWDGLPTIAQERAVGRKKASGKRLHAREMPADAHIALAAAHNNDGVRLLRRGYSYNDGIDPATHQVDAGLFFICYQRDPLRQFTTIQRRLGVNDALAKHLSHTSSAVFACPPGARPGGYVGERLFRRA
jgi:deferrochelatase/peroxidase EfeB